MKTLCPRRYPAHPVNPDHLDSDTDLTHRLEADAPLLSLHADSDTIAGGTPALQLLYEGESTQTDLTHRPP